MGVCEVRGWGRQVAEEGLGQEDLLPPAPLWHPLSCLP